MLRSIAIISLSVMLAAGCDLPDDGPSSTSSTETDGVSSTSSPATSSTDTEGMSSTSSPTTTTGDEPPVTECHEVLGGPGFEPPEELVGQICETCEGEDCGCPQMGLDGQCVLDCEDTTCPEGQVCLHLAWDGQDAWGCWPAPEPAPEPAPAPEPEPAPEPACKPVVDQVGTVIGQVCQEDCAPIWDADGMVVGVDCTCSLGIDPLTGICLVPCGDSCPKGQACRQVVIEQELISVCWPAEA